MDPGFRRDDDQKQGASTRGVRATDQFSGVIPAKAGIHLGFALKGTMDPGLRRDDDQKQGASNRGWGIRSTSQLRHSREGGNPVPFAGRSKRRWIPDIASRLRLQDCKRERRRRRVARAPWMARVFRDDEQKTRASSSRAIRLCLPTHEPGRGVAMMRGLPAL